MDFAPKLRVLLDDERAGAALDAVVEALRTGEVGDGKVRLTTVDTVVCVRTGERDADAL